MKISCNPHTCHIPSAVNENLDNIKLENAIEKNNSLALSDGLSEN